MGLTAAVSGYVFLLSVQVIQGQYGWRVTYTSTRICALKGSTVEISCTYTYPSRINGRDTIVQETFWFTQMNRYVPVDLRKDSRYTGRLQYSCSNNICTLRITDLRESDSAQYKLMFITNQPDGRFTGSPGVTLSVTDLHVQLSNQQLLCHSSCRLPDRPSYVWYKNGQTFLKETSYSDDISTADSYSCAVKGLEGFPSPSVCVYGHSCNRVTYTDRSICAFKGSSVDISCTYNSYYTYIRSKFWFSPERSLQWQNPSQPEDLSKDSQYAGRVQVLETERGRSTLRITDLRESDSAEYHFKFNTWSFEWRSSLPGTTLTVTDPDLQVQVIRSTVYKHYTDADLLCHSSCRLPDRSSYIWLKNGQKIQRETFSSYSVRSYSADSYSCAVKGLEGFPSPSVCVYGQTSNRVTYTDRSICAIKGSSVDISCTYNSYETITSRFWFSPERSLQWQNPSQPEDLSEDSQYAGRVQVLDTERGRSTLRITDLRESDSAEYHFKFTAGSFEWRSSLPGTTLTVTALQVQVTRIKVHGSYTEAALLCHSSCRLPDRPSYVWFKNVKKMERVETSSYKHKFYPGDIILCAVKGHEDFRSPSVYGPKLPSVSVSPSAEIVEGSSVTLTCSSDANPAAKYTWYKENQRLLSEEPQLVFSSIQSSDSGEYYCAAENELGRMTSEYIINVKYPPKLPSVSVSPSAEIVEGSSVTLTCSSDANPAAKYTWYKENQTLIQGPEDIYHFTSISSKDSGIYHCKSENKYGQINSTSVSIDVQYAPKLLSVSVSPSAEIVEGSSVTLTCSSDANPAANYTWYKENEDSPQASEQNFTITDIRAEHSGNYHCEAQNRRGRHNSTLHLTVVSGSMASAAAGSITAIFLALIFLCAFLLIRRKRSLKQTTEPGGRPDNTAQLNMGLVGNNPSAAAQRKPAEESNNLCYASVSFSENQEDPLYSNIRPAQPNRHKNEEEEDEDGVEYSAVNFKSGSTSAERQEALEDSSALYSTVTKKPRV